MSNLDEINTYMVKLVLIGNEGVGKTSLRRNYMGLTFRESYQMTVGADVSHKEYESDEAKAWVTIWDLAGQDEFKKIRQYYLKGASGALLVIDVTKNIAGDELQWWMSEVKEQLDQSFYFIAILFNKIDKTDEIVLNEHERIKLADRIRLYFSIQDLDFTIVETRNFETSAKNGENVEEAFNWIIKMCLLKLVEEESVTN